MCLILDTNKYGEFLQSDKSTYETCERLGGESGMEK